MSSLNPLDPDRIDKVLTAILQACRRNMLDGPFYRPRVLENLNALAMATATILEGTGDSQAQDFFNTALAQCRESLRRDRASFLGHNN